jgi:hypothetical protein
LLLYPLLISLLNRLDQYLYESDARIFSSNLLPLLQSQLGILFTNQWFMRISCICVYISFAKLLIQTHKLYPVNVEILEVSKHLLMISLFEIKLHIIIKKSHLLYLDFFLLWLLSCCISIFFFGFFLSFYVLLSIFYCYSNTVQQYDSQSINRNSFIFFSLN